MSAKRARAHHRAYPENVHADQAGGSFTGVHVLASVSDLTGSRALAGGVGTGLPDHGVRHPQSGEWMTSLFWLHTHGRK